MKDKCDYWIVRSHANIPNINVKQKVSWQILKSGKTQYHYYKIIVRNENVTIFKRLISIKNPKTTSIY